jgi:hypothetical protein
MKKLYLFFIIIILILFYLSFVNLSSYLVYNNRESVINDNINNGEGVNVGFSDKVDVSVRKERWYGVIIENINNNYNLNYLYLFNFIKLPINVNGVNWVWYHLIVIFFILTLVLLINKIYK